MYQLLLDSSNVYLSVGIGKNGEVIDSIYYEAWQRQSEMMVTEVDNILKRNNIAKEELDAVVVGIGPGSYTGVRIGVTIAKTIAYALKIKIYAKSSLSLLKDKEKPTICLFNARSGRSYFAAYEGNKTIVKTNEEVLDYINNHPAYIVNGDTYQLGLESGEFDILSNLAKFNDSELVDQIEDWVADHAYKNNYHIQGSTELEMIFDDIRIPLKDGNGRNYNINQFDREVRQLFRNLGFKVAHVTKNNHKIIII